jgi:glycosyltransferase involved in cell wall biosynthesis
MEPEASGDYRLDCVRGRAARADDVQVIYAQGDAFAAGRGARRIGFTMLEIDRLPREWVRQANLMDEIFVPSTFNAETFRASGVRPPISVVPLGVDPDYFNPGIIGHPLAGVFSFLSTFEWGARKAPEILLRAFHDEFRATDDVVLICKIINQDESVRVERAVADLGLSSGGGRVLFSLNEIVPTDQLGSLYRSADCFVLPTRGEGWGMPILEAMACGLPVIATDWSAPRDFMNSGNAYPLEVERMVPAELTSPYYRGARWAEPSYEHLRALLRHVYENREEARAKGRRASREVLGRWTWDESASRIRTRLAEVAPGSWSPSPPSSQ